MFSAPFSDAAVDALRPAIEGIVDDVIDGMERAKEEGGADDEIDLAEGFSYPVAFRVIYRILGISPEVRAGRFLRWTGLPGLVGCCLCGGARHHLPRSFPIHAHPPAPPYLETNTNSTPHAYIITPTQKTGRQGALLQRGGARLGVVHRARRRRRPGLYRGLHGQAGG
jgi:hypothetical protein